LSFQVEVETWALHATTVAGRLPGKRHKSSARIAQNLSETSILYVSEIEKRAEKS
jgi:hypothetical protein